MRLTISVDDGHPLDLRMAELLERHHMPATFYLPITNHEGEPVLSGADARTLAQRFEVGSHTLSHRFLTTLDERSAWHEVFDGKRALEDKLGRYVCGFCFPGGRFGRLHLQQVRKAGFLFARTTQNLRIDTDNDDFRLPVSAQFYPHPPQVWVRNFLSQKNWFARMAALRAVLSESDWLARLYKLHALAQARGGVFHLWCHSIDIERLGLWKTLDRFLSDLAQQVPQAARMTNGALCSPLLLQPAPLSPALLKPAPPAASPTIPPPDARRHADPRRPASRPSTPSGSSAT